ncbi:MAG: AMP-binding protein [Burkholderiaceae bacterium]|nr:AMP-binding protein [Burkholderiaceae bacterium]
MSTIAGLFAATAVEHAGATALLAPDRTPLSYAGLHRQLLRTAATLGEAGLDHGARIAVSVPNGPEAAAATIAVAAYATCAPLNPAYQAAEFRFYLEDARASAVVVRRGERGPIRTVAAELGLAVFELCCDEKAPAGTFELLLSETGRHTGPAGADRGAGAGLGRDAGAGAGSSRGADRPTDDDVALILHTSGTTARPKIVPLSQANLVASARNIAAHLALAPSDRALNVMPLFHIHGLVGSLLATLSAGGSVVCTPGFDEACFFEWIAEFDPSWYSAVPTIHQAIVASGSAYRRRTPLHRFRFARSSSSALSPTTLHDLEALLDAPVVEAYGMTEASHQMTSNPLPPGIRKAGSVGVPAGVAVAILDDSGRELARGLTGEIAIRGPGVTTGYESNPEANAKAFTRGWFRTGDQGRLDDDGYLYIAGRIKEIVNRGGEKIAPREVDEALLGHPDVAQAAAFAVPHPSLGEDLAAVVVPRKGCSPREGELREFLLGRLAGFKVPSQIVFVDAIPKGPTGKVQRTTLHAKLADALARPFTAPRGETESMLESVVCEVLQKERFSVHENFFAAGGDSLRATQVIGRINQRLSLGLPVVSLFRHPSLAELAGVVDEALRARAERDEALQARIDAMSDEEVERMLAELERDERERGAAGASRAG